MINVFGNLERVATDIYLLLDPEGVRDVNLFLQRTAYDPTLRPPFEGKPAATGPLTPSRDGARMRPLVPQSAEISGAAETMASTPDSPLDLLVTIRSQAAEAVVAYLEHLKKICEELQLDDERREEIREKVEKCLEPLRQAEKAADQISLPAWGTWDNIRAQLTEPEIDACLDQNDWKRAGIDRRHAGARMAAAVLVAITTKDQQGRRLRHWLWTRLTAARARGSQAPMVLFVGFFEGQSPTKDGLADIETQFRVAIRSRKLVKEAAAAVALPSLPSPLPVAPAPTPTFTSPIFVYVLAILAFTTIVVLSLSFMAFLSRDDGDPRRAAEPPVNTELVLTEPSPPEAQPPRPAEASTERRITAGGGGSDGGEPTITSRRPSTPIGASATSQAPVSKPTVAASTPTKPLDHQSPAIEGPSAHPAVLPPGGSETESPSTPVPTIPAGASSVPETPERVGEATPDPSPETKSDTPAAADRSRESPPDLPGNAGVQPGSLRFALTLHKDSDKRERCRNFGLKQVCAGRLLGSNIVTGFAHVPVGGSVVAFVGSEQRRVVLDENGRSESIPILMGQGNTVLVQVLSATGDAVESFNFTFDTTP